MARGETRFFGDPTPIQQNYLPGDFLAESEDFRPIKSVHIQVGVDDADMVRETQWLQGLPAFPHGVVAYCDLSADNRESVLDAHAEFSRFRGVRQIVGRHLEEDRKHGSEALPGNPQWINGLRSLARRGLSFDLQLIPQQHQKMREILESVPDLPVAICHCGSPWDQSVEGLQRWREGMREFAALPHVYCKVSGLGMFNRSWTCGELRPLILDVIELFGPERVMFGSNFPVDKLYRSYQALWQAYSDITAGFNPDQRDQMFRRTAESFYRL